MLQNLYLLKCLLHNCILIHMFSGLFHFEIEGLLDFYLEIDAFITRSLFKEPCTIAKNDSIFPTYYSYNLSMKTADKLLSRIEKTAEIINN